MCIGIVLLLQTSMGFRVFALIAFVHVTSGQTWLQKPNNKSVTIGSNVRIACETQGTAQLTVIWSKDSVPIFVNGQRGVGISDRYTIEANNTLAIRDVKLVDASSYTCNVFGFESVKIYLKVTGGPLSCLSCSSVDNSSSCKHSISCENGEVCYTHRYVTESGRENFDFGCSNAQSCASSISRRLAKRSDGRHNLCSSCCNNTDLCNKYSHCEGHEKGINRSCLSCTDVSPKSTCKNIITCAENEVCFTHHYTTESGDDKYDLGCSSFQSCPSASPQFVGKRADGRHSRCYACCNETDSCNKQTRCNKDYEGAKPISHECSSGGLIGTVGVYSIFPGHNGSNPVKVYCKRGPNGFLWTVIQRRFDGLVNFTRDWNSYKNGFGDVTGEYWIGNDVIHSLTSDGKHELRIDITDDNNDARFAQYGYFMVDGEAENYRLHVSNYTGDAGDSLSYHDGHEFSTPDRDNDGYSLNCAARSMSGWWFNGCYYSDLNGRYKTDGERMYWRSLSGTLKTVTMMIRKVS